MGYNNDDRGGSRGGNRGGSGFGGGGRSFGGGGNRGGFGGGGNRGGYGDREERVMHKATCDNCGNNCEVPFKPTGNKPVLCSDCFRKDRPDSRNDRGNDRGGDRNFDRPRRDFGGDDRPRRDDRPRMSEGRSEHYEVEFEKLNAKLDKILDRLTPKHTRDGVKAVEPSDEDIDPNDFL